MPNVVGAIISSITNWLSSGESWEIGEGELHYASSTDDAVILELRDAETEETLRKFEIKVREIT